MTGHTTSVDDCYIHGTGTFPHRDGCKCEKCVPPSNPNLTPDECNALRDMLKYAWGEHGKSQRGYFSPGGWAGHTLQKLLERAEATPDKTFARQPGDCEHARASIECPDCGIDFIGTLMVPARHTLDCDMVKHPNCTHCNCGSSIDPDSSWHAHQSPQASVPAIGAPTGPAAPCSQLEPARELSASEAASFGQP